MLHFGPSKHSSNFGGLALFQRKKENDKIHCVCLVDLHFLKKATTSASRHSALCLASDCGVGSPKKQLSISEFSAHEPFVTTTFQFCRFVHI